MKLKRNETESVAMFEKKQREKRFCEYVSSHVRGRYPVGLKRTFRNVIVNEMVADINVFGTRRYCFRFNKGKSTLVVTEEQKRSWNR